MCDELRSYCRFVTTVDFVEGCLHKTGKGGILVKIKWYLLCLFRWCTDLKWINDTVHPESCCCIQWLHMLSHSLALSSLGLLRWWQQWGFWLWACLLHYLPSAMPSIATVPCTLCPMYVSQIWHRVPSLRVLVSNCHSNRGSVSSDTPMTPGHWEAWLQFRGRWVGVEVLRSPLLIVKPALMFKTWILYCYEFRTLAGLHDHHINSITRT